MESGSGAYEHILADADLADKEEQIAHGPPFLPPTQFQFDLILITELFIRFSKTGFAKGDPKRIHVHLFRRSIQRLLDIFELRHVMDVGVLGNKRHTCYLTWDQICETLSENPMPPVNLRCVERILLTIDDSDSSWTAYLYAYFMMLVIFSNLVLITVKSMPELCEWRVLGILCNHMTETALLYIYTIEYVIRMMCVPFSRHGVFDRKWLLDAVVPDSLEKAQGALNSSPLQKLWQWCTTCQALVDLVSFLPFWVMLIFGESCAVPLSLVRVFKLLRVFRLLKLARFNDTLQVLGATLARSMHSVQVLTMYMLMSSVIVGAVLQTLEPETEGFETVPAACWWAFFHIFGLRPFAPSWAPGRPVTYTAGMVMTLVGAIQKILWVLPFGPISEAMVEERQAAQDKAKIVQDCAISTHHSKAMWISNFTSAFVRVEVFNGEKAVAAGCLPVPLFRKSACKDKVPASLHAGVLVRKYAKAPELNFLVTWYPDAGAKTLGGNLQLKLLRGYGFPRWWSRGWQIKLHVPLQLYGKGRGPDWESSVSAAGTAPEWHDAPVSFNICWDDKSSASDSKSDQAVENVGSFRSLEQHLLQDQVLELISKQQRQLDDQTKKIESLEKVINRVVELHR